MPFLNFDFRFVSTNNSFTTKKLYVHCQVIPRVPHPSAEADVNLSSHNNSRVNGSREICTSKLALVTLKSTVK